MIMLFDIETQIVHATGIKQQQSSYKNYKI